ncbi:hypothetical protein DEO72_LG6g2971 [Vigna unguiculata]|uniref:Uncharacterized protein n=1 Tax=Vigna unguiculata TaxID=3917 RepID=A0A4D6MBS1_VIGUN|nr:hypothetical protein DEO72_LG6g2971 [Vigna unguiculata]
MEAKSSVITNKQARKKLLPTNALCIGGEGGIAGLLVFGGALAIAGFMAVASFANNKQKAKATRDQQTKPQQQLLLDEHECKNEDDHDTTQSLTSLVNNSSIENGDATCYWTSDTSIDQEEKSELKPRSGDEESPTEIVLSDSSPPQSAASSNGSVVADECMVSLFNRPGGQEPEPDEKDEVPEDDLTSSETETETEEEEEEEEMMSDEVSESGSEDTSKETGTTSLDYKEEQVWPSELVQRAKQKLKGEKNHVCSRTDVDSSDYEEEVTMAHQANLNQNLNLFMDPNNQALTWIFPLLLLALLMLLVLLTYHPHDSFYVLDDESHSVVRRI